MVVTHGMFPLYALTLKVASNLSDKSLPSNVRRRLEHHSLHENFTFVYSEHLTT